MIFEVEISNQADIDLRNIYEYIAFELQSPMIASGQIDRLEKSIIGLNQMPARFRKYEKEPWHSRGLRIMTIDNYFKYFITYILIFKIFLVTLLYKLKNKLWTDTV